MIYRQLLHRTMALSQNPISVVDNILHMQLEAYTPGRVPDAKISLMEEEHSARSGTER